jgi:hypothetical protein
MISIKKQLKFLLTIFLCVIIFIQIRVILVNRSMTQKIESIKRWTIEHVFKKSHRQTMVAWKWAKVVKNTGQKTFQHIYKLMYMKTECI